MIELKNNFPTSPDGKTGWPWNSDIPIFPPKMPDRKSWPKISIITPSFNQGAYLEETIRSVLLQGYPNLEYIIIDGGSTDNSVKIIKKYEPWLTFWVSEKDKGQSHAINKGLRIVTGDIVGYLNSDDLLLSSSLLNIAKAFNLTGFDIFVGCRLHKFSYDGFHWKMYFKMFTYPWLLNGKYFKYDIPQECVFWKNKKYIHNKFNEELQFCLDVDWFIDIFSGAKMVHSSDIIGYFRQHNNSKTYKLQHIAANEIKLIIERNKFIIKEISLKKKLYILFNYYSLTVITNIVKMLIPNKTMYLIYKLPHYKKIK